jgi:hypothetical protein
MSAPIPEHVRVLIDEAAARFIAGNTPEIVKPTFKDGDMAYLIFWREVEIEVKRRSGRTAVIPEWYKTGWF